MVQVRCLNQRDSCRDGSPPWFPPPSPTNHKSSSGVETTSTSPQTSTVQKGPLCWHSEQTPLTCSRTNQGSSVTNLQSSPPLSSAQNIPTPSRLIGVLQTLRQTQTHLTYHGSSGVKPPTYSPSTCSVQKDPLNLTKAQYSQQHQHWGDGALLAQRTRTLAYFGSFWLFCREFTHFMVYFNGSK